jgi:hypothetical protein
MNNVVALPPNPFAELKEQATLAFRSNLLPRSIDTVEKAIVVALAGKELGLSPMAALTGIYVVNGMYALRGATMLRLIYERIPGARITVLTPPEKADRECVVEMARPNSKPQVFRFTLEDAKKAGYSSKATWQQHTATMLRWAAIRTGARIVFADAIAGCYMEDELEEAQVGEQKAEAVRASLAPAPEVLPAESEPEPAPPIGDYVIPMGVPKWAGMRLSEVDASALADYCLSKREQAERERKRIGGALREFLEKAEAFLSEQT